MTSQLDFTGERFVPGIPGEIAHEHWHRYAFARRFVAGRRVLDVACGEGYGSALLAAGAAEVVGVDIAEEAVAHARATYAAMTNLRYEAGSAAALPLADASVEAVVSFETIEHLAREDQPRMVAEIARVLAPDGILVISAPNPVEYSQARHYRNPFHSHEPPRDELRELLAWHFPVQQWFAQRRYFGSAIWNEAGAGAGFEAWAADESRLAPAPPPAAMYFVVVAGRRPDALRPPAPALSLLADREEIELARIDARAAEVLRLDALLKSRDESMDRATQHVRHLEELVAVRERLVEARDAQLREIQQALADNHARAQDEAAQLRAQYQRTCNDLDAARSEAASQAEALVALAGEQQRLEGALAAQERIIAYRQSARWWASLPWLRLRMLLRRKTGT
mgnify:CR=1 FL=1